MQKPPTNLYPGFFQKYIQLVKEEDLNTAFAEQLPIIISFISSISEQKSSFKYADDKWTLKEVLQHVIDTERIFSYRALCFSRGEKVSLPGFDEKAYAAKSNANHRTWNSLGNEFLIVRQSTQSLFTSFSEPMLLANGIANNTPNTAYGFGFTLLGHFYHHKNIVAERYL